MIHVYVRYDNVRMTEDARTNDERDNNVFVYMLYPEIRDIHVYRSVDMIVHPLPNDDR